MISAKADYDLAVDPAMIHELQSLVDPRDIEYTRVYPWDDVPLLDDLPTLSSWEPSEQLNVPYT